MHSAPNPFPGASAAFRSGLQETRALIRKPELESVVARAAVAVAQRPPRRAQGYGIEGDPRLSARSSSPDIFLRAAVLYPGP